MLNELCGMDFVEFFRICPVYIFFVFAPVCFYLFLNIRCKHFSTQGVSTLVVQNEVCDLSFKKIRK